MKEATGEGSMTVITIVIIVALGVAAALIVGLFLSQSANEASDISADNTRQNMQDGSACTKGFHMEDGKIVCDE